MRQCPVGVRRLPRRQVSSTVSEATNETPWGRVDENRTVYVREGDTERAVGEFPDGTSEEALAYFTRKFADLEGQVTLLERLSRLLPTDRGLGLSGETLGLDHDGLPLRCSLLLRGLALSALFLREFLGATRELLDAIPQ